MIETEIPSVLKSPCKKNVSTASIALKEINPKWQILRLWRRVLEDAVNYKSLMEELRKRLGVGQCGKDKSWGEIRDGFRCRLACMLDDDPHAPLKVLLDRLTEKWERDGLL